jgi:hypothetical protein
MRRRFTRTIRAAVLLDQSRGNWQDINHVWQHSGTHFQFPEIVDSHQHAECYLVIAASSRAAVSKLTLVQSIKEFDPNKPVIWIDHTRKVVDIFGCTSLLMAEIRAGEREKERGIRRLIEHLSGSPISGEKRS